MTDAFCSVGKKRKEKKRKPLGLMNQDAIATPSRHSYKSTILSVAMLWITCHHGMMCPQVADGDSLQIRMVAANILNKQSWTADRGWPSSFGVERGANNPHCKIICYKMFYRASDLDRFFGMT
jgi:hypothetical protein